MVSEAIIPLIDAIATLGFLAAAAIGALNYRDTDLERSFRAVFLSVSPIGSLCMVFVTVEWIGCQGSLKDTLSTALQ